MKSYNYCNNCDQNTHSVYQCKLPILSLGVIAAERLNNKLNYLMICRKDSLGYVDFIRGKYSILDKMYLQNIIDEMTVQEKNNILTLSFDILWNNLWSNYNGLQYRGEKKSSKDKFELLKTGVIIDNSIYTLKELVDNSTTTWEMPEWGFPKGKRNYRENDYDCAIREFEEETGIHKENLILINNIGPLEEMFTGSNYKSYKHKYFVAFLKSKNINLTNFQKSEVSKLEWKSFDECIKTIRPYNLEKIDIITKLNKVLEKYTIYL